MILWWKFEHVIEMLASFMRLSEKCRQTITDIDIHLDSVKKGIKDKHFSMEQLEKDAREDGSNLGQSVHHDY
jgi:hypothetical protein